MDKLALKRRIWTARGWLERVVSFLWLAGSVTTDNGSVTFKARRNKVTKAVTINVGIIPGWHKIGRPELFKEATGS